MTVKECYEEMGADYQGVLERLLKEERIYKFVLKFKDSMELHTLLEAINEKNWETAFIKVHNIKGMCLNLGITKLCEISSELCEELRYGEPKNDISEMLDKLTEEYNRTVGIIEKL